MEWAVYDRSFSFDEGVCRMENLLDVLKSDGSKLLTGKVKMGRYYVECFFWYDSELMWVVNLMNDDTVVDIPDDVLKSLFDHFDRMYRDRLPHGEYTYELTVGYHGKTPISSAMFLDIVCPECSGRGTIESTEDVPCYSCAGMGYDGDGDECDTCDGSGYLEEDVEEDCDRCNGFGDTERDEVLYDDVVGRG